MRTKTTLDLCDIVSDLRGHNKLLKANEKGLRAANVELAEQLRVEKANVLEWARLERLAREDVTRAQARADELSRDLAQVRADFHSAHDAELRLTKELEQLRPCPSARQGYDGALSDVWNRLRGTTGEICYEIDKIMAAIDERVAQAKQPMEEVIRELRHELDNARVAIAPRPQKPAAAGPVCEPCGTLMVPCSTGGYRCLNCEATAPAEDPAICTVGDLRMGLDEPLDVAEAVDDLRDDSGALIVERGTRIIVERRAERGTRKVSTPDGGSIGYVVPTGRVRRTGETDPPQAQAEHQPPRRAPDAYTPPVPPRKGA